LVNKSAEIEIGFIIVNDLWITEEDLELIERSLKQANLPPTVTVKPLLKEIRHIYMPTTLEARNYCEPFQEFRKYVKKRFNYEKHDYSETFSLFQEFAKENKKMYREILYCTFFNYCISWLGRILHSIKTPHIFLLLPNSPTFNSPGITFQMDLEGKKTMISLIHFKGTEIYKASVLIHELGHHFGLASCPNKNCVMALHETIETEYATSLPNKFCNTCKQKIEEHIFQQK